MLPVCNDTIYLIIVFALCYSCILEIIMAAKSSHLRPFLAAILFCVAVSLRADALVPKGSFFIYLFLIEALYVYPPPKKKTLIIYYIFTYWLLFPPDDFVTTFRLWVRNLWVFSEIGTRWNEIQTSFSGCGLWKRQWTTRMSTLIFMLNCF